MFQTRPQPGTNHGDEDAWKRKLNKQMYHFRVCSLGCLYITTHHPVTVLRILVQLLISYRIIPGI